MTSPVPRHIWNQILPPREYRAALIGSRSRPRIQLHTHDYFEMMYVLEGAGTHEINGQSLPLRAGELIFVRPPDRHAVSVRGGDELVFVSIAFPAEAWTAFRAFVNLTHEAFSAESVASPPTVRLPAAHRDDCAQVFRETLRAFHEAPSSMESRMELCRFWAQVLPFLLRPLNISADADPALPTWLPRACQAIRDETNLRVGLPRFVELSGVGPAHLSRTFKTWSGQTPTEFINELRLQRAALLLTTTPHDITEVAADCGFENLSYFYRLFSRRFGTSPRAYRLRAQRAVVP